MRVTSGMVRQGIITNMNSALARLQLAQTQIATGKRVFRPSDDPAGIAKSVNIKALLRDAGQFKKNIDDGLSWLETSEAAVNDMSEIITELKEIVVQGASDNLGADERAALGEQVEMLIQGLLDSTNTKYGPKYVFAGTYTLTQPYSASQDVTGEAFSLSASGWTDLVNPRLESGSVVVRGPASEVYVEGVDYEIDYGQGRIRSLSGGGMAEGVTYTIDYTTETVAQVVLNVPDTGGEISREVAQGVRERVNQGGEEILNSSVDVFSLLVRAKNALFRNDSNAVRGCFDEVDSALDQVTSSLGKIGATIKGFNLASGRLESETVNLKALVSGIEDADLAEVMVNLQAEQYAYEAALGAASSILNTSLVNFLK
jgi:flagellar hook-associated protein 3 FlgL